MRKIMKDTLIELATKDPKIVFLTGDLGVEYNDYRKIFPDRYFNFGVCEQSMISLSSGMALEGFRPYVYSITPFLLERPFEQIKVDLDFQKVNVKLIGFADYHGMGPTHAELDWRTIGKVFKNTQFYFPSSAYEVRKAMYDSYEYHGPAIISLKKIKS